MRAASRGKARGPAPIEGSPGAETAPEPPRFHTPCVSQSQVYFFQSSIPTTTPEVGVKPFKGFFWVMNS